MSTNERDCILVRLYDLVRDRCLNPRDDSYITSLLKNAPDALSAKITEEASELTEACETGTRDHIIHEVADLWFHCLVLLGSESIPPDEIYQELERRWGTSGLTEKAQRGKRQR